MSNKEEKLECHTGFYNIVTDNSIDIEVQNICFKDGSYLCYAKREYAEELVKLWNTRAQTSREAELDKNYMHVISAANSLIGYIALKEGDTLTKGYVDRLENHYVVNLEKALANYKKEVGSER